MKTMLLAAAAVLSLGVGAAYAGDGDGYSASTRFTNLAAQQDHVRAPGPIAPSSSDLYHIYGSTAKPLGTWLYAPAQNAGGNS